MGWLLCSKRQVQSKACWCPEFCPSYRLKNLVARNRGRRAAYGDWARRFTPRTAAAARVGAHRTPRQGASGPSEQPGTASRTIPAAENGRFPTVLGHARRGEPSPASRSVREGWGRGTVVTS